MKLRPGGTLWFLRHELRLAWRRTLGGPSRKWMLGFMALTAMILLFGGYWIVRAFAILAPGGDTGIGLVVMGAMAFFGLLIVSQVMTGLITAFYDRNDLDLLLSAPLQPWRFFSIRITAIALAAGAFYFLMLAPVLVWAPVFGAWKALAAAPALLALTLFAAAVAIVLVQVLLKTIGPRHARTVSQVFGALIGAVFVLATQGLNLLPKAQREAATNALAAALAEGANPLLLPAHAALGDGAALLAWMLISAASFAAAVLFFSRGIHAQVAMFSGLDRARTQKAAARVMSGGSRAALVRKEWRLLVRDPMLIGQGLLPMFYVLPAMISSKRLFDEGGAMADVGITVLAGVAVFACASLADHLAWITISTDDAPDLVAAAPVKRDDVVRAKVIAAATPSLALLMLPVLLALTHSWRAGGAILIGGSAAIASGCLVAVWQQRPQARAAFKKRPTPPFWIGIAQFLLAGGWASATGLLLGGQWIFAAILALLIACTLAWLRDARPGAGAESDAEPPRNVSLPRTG